jgi:hypothetical protein
MKTIQTSEITIDHPAVPWIVAELVGKEVYVDYEERGIRIYYVSSVCGEFNPLTADVMCDLGIMLQDLGYIHIQMLKTGYLKPSHHVLAVREARLTEDESCRSVLNGHGQNNKEAMVMCAIRTRESFEVPDELI